MSTLSLFQAYGVEMEYMIVDRDTLNVSPIADKVMFDEVGEYTDEVERGPIAWSNELAMQVIELKTNGPASDLNLLPVAFNVDVQHINSILYDYNAMLLPTGTHPWMNPHTEAKLWPYGNKDIYEAYHRIFNCQGHGWINLQSTHLNLPFADDAEFERLHTAIRLLLPLMPALTASTPFMDGKSTGYKDARIAVYRDNQKRIPNITGLIIPELVKHQEDYQSTILKPMYQAIAPFDEHGILQFEWLNSRGAIARFDRNAIEIRLLDIQECPWADIACIHLISETLKSLVSERWSTLATQQSFDTEALSACLNDIIITGMDTVINLKGYGQAFGLNQSSFTAREFWQHCFEHAALSKSLRQPVEVILKHGNLAERLLKQYKQNSDLKACYAQLAECLQQGHPYEPSS